jgi:hypothetical protein
MSSSRRRSSSSRRLVESRFSAQELGDVALEIEQLARLLEQLLCLARLDSQEQSQSAAFDAHAVALEVARELAPVALQSEHYVTAATPDVSVSTHGNARLTRLVFRNLIENAIQYTPAGTSITVSADSATVIIADDGPGLAAHAAASLFERFRRGPNAPGPGAGLGLAIAKCIMERQGGRLSLDTNAARGARFVVAFPERFHPGNRVEQDQKARIVEAAPGWKKVRASLTLTTWRGDRLLGKFAATGVGAQKAKAKKPKREGLRHRLVARARRYAESEDEVIYRDARQRDGARGVIEARGGQDAGARRDDEPRGRAELRYDGEGV